MDRYSGLTLKYNKAVYSGVTIMHSWEKKTIMWSIFVYSFLVNINLIDINLDTKNAGEDCAKSKQF